MQVRYSHSSKHTETEDECWLGKTETCVEVVYGCLMWTLSSSQWSNCCPPVGFVWCYTTGTRRARSGSWSSCTPCPGTMARWQWRLRSCLWPANDSSARWFCNLSSLSGRPPMGWTLFKNHTGVVETFDTIEMLVLLPLSKYSISKIVLSRCSRLRVNPIWCHFVTRARLDYITKY